MEQVIELIQKSQAGDKKAREQLITENMGLVYSMVKRFENRGKEKEELIQIGSIGLLKAVDQFDCNYDVKFSTYAAAFIKNGEETGERIIDMVCDGKVRYTVPQMIRPDDMEETLTVRFRVANVYKNASIVVKAAGKELIRRKKQIMAPGEMEQVVLKKADLASADRVEIGIEEA